MNLRVPKEPEFRDNDIADIHPLFGQHPEASEKPPPGRSIIPGAFLFFVMLGLTASWLYWVSSSQEKSSQPAASLISEPSPVASTSSVAAPVEKKTVIQGRVTRKPVLQRTVPAWPQSAERRFVALAGYSWIELNENQTVKATVSLKPIASEPSAPSKQPKVAKIVRSVPSARYLEKEKLNEAKHLAFTGEVYRAKVALLRFLESYPQAEESRQVLASWMIKDHQWLEVKALLADVGLESSFQVRLLKARVLVQHGDIAGAVRLLEYAPPPLTAAPAYHALLGACYQRQSRFAEAVTVFSKLTRMREARGGWWAGLAVSLDKAGAYREALKAYRQVVKLPGMQPALREFAYQRISLLSRRQG